MYSKEEVIDYIWQYSRYYGDLLAQSDLIYTEEIGAHSALINLFNLTEIILKSKVDDYDINFYGAVKKLNEQGLINNTEEKFLNDKYTGIRKIRNIFAHSNLSKYIFVFPEEPNILYPATEISTCEILYEKLSVIIYNIILKVVSSDLIIDLKFDLDNDINNCKFTIKELSAEDILKFKGIDYRSFGSEWSAMTETKKYILAENASDVNILESIFANLFAN